MDWRCAFAIGNAREASGRVRMLQVERESACTFATGMSDGGPDGRAGAHAARGGEADGRAPGRRRGRARPRGAGPRILTERDILHSVGAGQDPDAERVADHLTADIVFAAPDWSLEQAPSRWSAAASAT